MGTDCAVVNGGCLRANAVIPAGTFKAKLIAEIFPIPETVAVKKLPGKSLLAVLENGVGGYPKYEGRWPCISGMKFSFDPEKPVGQRILMDTFLMEDGTPFDIERTYTVATTSFLTLGKDGFEAFLDPGVEDATGQLDEAITVQELIKQFLRNFRRTPQRVEELKPLKYYPIFEERLKKFNASVEKRDS